jgi:hypothetical protein
MRRPALIVVAIGLALLPLFAFADHYDYFAQDPGKQQDPPGVRLNYNHRFWAIGQGSMWWQDKAVPLDQIWHDEILAAIAEWQGPSPKLPNAWWEAIPGLIPELVFEKQPCLVGHSCFLVNNWWTDTDRNARYWDRASIRANPNISWAAGQRKGALVHEIGHAYGLHERYRHPPPASLCNDSEFTVMDTNKKVWDAQQQKWVDLIPMEMCDTISSQSPDLSRATTYWSQGKLDDWTASGYGTPLGAFNWKDYAWAEGHKQ